ncbi:MAG: hypothetical protein ACE14L_11625 [Terriglobales bacterium]
MVRHCANEKCSAPFRKFSEGKLFCVQIEIVNAAGQQERKVEYVWLCPRCADQMVPRIDVSGDKVTVRLTLTDKPNVPQPSPRLN